MTAQTRPDPNNSAFVVLAIGAVIILAFLWLVANGPPATGGRLTHAKLIATPSDEEYDEDGWRVPKPEEVRDLKSFEVDTTVSHGTTKHPEEADEVWACLDQKGALGGRVFRLGNQWLRLCDLGQHDLSGDPDDRWWGVNIVKRDRIDGRWVEVTSYVPKLKDRTIYGVLDWLKARGWVIAK